MKVLFKQLSENEQPIETDLTPVNLKESLEKTRQALEIAYAGFDNAVEIEMIDSYIYEINSLQKRYNYLTGLAGSQPEVPTPKSYQHSPIRTLVSHVFG